MSAGISLYPSDGKDADSLIKNADTALYRAKDSGRNSYQLYRPAMTTQAVERLRLEGDLRQALYRGEFFIEYQPVLDGATSQIVGNEALIRWDHPERGLVMPDDFISVAEDTGLIADIGTWVLKSACRQTRQWQLDGLPPMRIAVNVSAAQFCHPDFVACVRTVLEETRLDPSLLELEFTESVAMREIDQAISVMKELRTLGVRMTIDNFGSGFSSLTHLKNLPLDNLKIDRTFINDLLLGRPDAMIARSIILLAHNLNLRVIAVGVETPEQAAFLQSRDCDEMQGFFWSKPLAAERFEELVRERRKAAQGEQQAA
jgi:EAL domain-containing protein (putative c-di-GMP-specific phosphodiesterase class I)